MFIGDKKIKKVSDEDGEGNVIVEFKHEPSVEIKKKLFDQIVKDKQGRGNITDAINFLFAVKFLMELSENGLEFYFVDGIGVSMKTLAHNLREELFRKTFDCTGGDAIALDKLMEDEDETKKQAEGYIKGEETK